MRQIALPKERHHTPLFHEKIDWARKRMKKRFGFFFCFHLIFLSNCLKRLLGYCPPPCFLLSEDTLFLRTEANGRKEMIHDLVKQNNIVEIAYGEGGVWGHFSRVCSPDHRVCEDGTRGSEKLNYGKWTKYLLHFPTVVISWWLCFCVYHWW